MAVENVTMPILYTVDIDEAAIIIDVVIIDVIIIDAKIVA
jgi:hypothetical protein